MKRQSLTYLGRIMMVLLLTGGLLASCSSSDNEDISAVQEVFEDDYFSIPGAVFEDGMMPVANSTDLEIFSITGNATVIAGGSNLVRVQASDNAKQVVAGVLGEQGYYRLPMTTDAGNNASASVDLQMLISRQTADHYIIAFSVTDDEDNYSEYEYLEVDLQEAGIGDLQISLTWDQFNDVDLHLIQPDGQHIYYGYRLSTNGGWLDLDSNPACYIDEVNNENIFYSDDEEVVIQNGVYEVLVDLWANCEIDEETNYGIVAYYGDQIITPTEGENPHYGYLTQEDESHNTNLISVMKFEITGETDVEGDDELDRPVQQNAYNALAPVKQRKVVNFRYDKNNKVFKNYNVKE